MKYIMMLVLPVLITAQAVNAAEVKSAKLDADKQNLLVDVTYGGGCKKHTFALKMNACAETYPVQCTANLVDTSPEIDPCEALLSQTLTFNLAKLGLNTDYYSEASLKILGDIDYNGKKSSASVLLPKFSNSDSSSQVIADVECTTHTSSKLSINNAKNEVILQTVDGKEAVYQVIGQKKITIETYPSIDSTTYSLDDGRKIVVEVRSGKKTGRGYFIRLNGEASPEFQCSVSEGSSLE